MDVLSLSILFILFIVFNKSELIKKFGFIYDIKFEQRFRVLFKKHNDKQS